MKCMMSTKGEKKMDKVVTSAKKFFKAMEKVLEIKGKTKVYTIYINSSTISHHIPVNKLQAINVTWVHFAKMQETKWDIKSSH